MRTEDWARVEAAFERLVALPPEEQRQELACLGREDAALRGAVEDLLAADREAGDFLAAPVLPRSASPSLLGRRLGAYRIEEKIAEGGMGAVYLAVRDDREYERRVAVKVLGHGAGHEDLPRRFRIERQILATLEHPGIARLLDGGTTEEGLPYLVMEHIDGLPVDRYCDERKLGLEDRIALFLEICGAVAYAHRNLVVHRDLKPSNILVTPEGSPRLLDFGIARLLEPAAEGERTRTGLRLMTPQFASPEQIAGGPVTTASDVYALGVLLYFLLTGTSPYRFDPQRLGDVERAVVEQEPERPSAAAPRPLARKLAGDLDNIVLMALAKEPARRYGSVEALAEDLRRWRQGLPVSARPATVGYRLRKLLARHPFAVPAGAAAALLIAGLAVTMTVQTVRLARQSGELQRERDKAVATTRFLQDIFRLSAPEQARGETITAREILDVGARRIPAELARQPETQAALLKTLGEVYHGLGLDGRARPLLERALRLRRTLGDGGPEVAESLEALGAFHLDRGEAAEAEAAWREAYEIRGAGSPELARTLHGLAMTRVLQGRHEEAEPLLRQALEIARRRFGAAHEETARILGDLGVALDRRGDRTGAEALFRESLALTRRVHGQWHPETARRLNDLAELLVRQGRFAAAEAAQRESLAISRRVHGDRNPQTAEMLHNLAFLLIERGEPARAEAPARESLALLRSWLGDANPKVALSLNNLARIEEDLGNTAAAVALYEEAARIQRGALGGGHSALGVTLANLAKVLGESGQLDRAESLAREALEIRRRALPPAHPELGHSYVLLGQLTLARGDGEAAEDLVRQGYEVYRQALPRGHWMTASIASFLGEILADRGKPAEAGPLLRSGYETLAAASGAPPRATILALERLAAFEEAQGHPRRAAGYRARLARLRTLSRSR